MKEPALDAEWKCFLEMCANQSKLRDEYTKQKREQHQIYLAKHRIDCRLSRERKKLENQKLLSSQ
jgi:hypothetical protein